MKRKSGSFSFASGSKIRLGLALVYTQHTNCDENKLFPANNGCFMILINVFYTFGIILYHLCPLAFDYLDK